MRLPIKLLFAMVFGLWLLLGSHIFFTFLEKNSPKQPVKGGTLVHATMQKPNFLPYVSDGQLDNYIQNLTFNGCLSTFASGSHILYLPDLCTVKTKDYQTFTIALTSGNKWSDGQTVSIEDILFTYGSFVPQLTEQTKVKIAKQGSGLAVTFPNASIDNQIFFTQKILPAHILSGTTIDYYKNVFSKNIITTSCGKIKESNDPSSLIIDQSSCENAWSNNYQIKYFASQNDMREFEGNKQPIDIYFDKFDSTTLTTQKVVLNKFMVLFYNTKTIPAALRQNINLLIDKGYYTDETSDFLVKDNLVFTKITATGNTQKLLIDFTKAPALSFTGSELTGSSSSLSSSGAISSGAQSSLSSMISSSSISSSSSAPVVPPQPTYTTVSGKLDLGPDVYHKTFYLTQDRLETRIWFAGYYDNVTISHNGGAAYRPKSFSPSKNNADYNIDVALKNISVGKNVYTIRATKNGKTVTWYFTLYYKTVPPSPPKPAVASSSSAVSISSSISINHSGHTISSAMSSLTGNSSSSVLSSVSSGSSSSLMESSSSGESSTSSSTKNENKKIRVIYLASESDRLVADNLKKVFAKNNIIDYFEFTEVSADKLMNVLENQEYDMIIRTINMGKKRDISPLFLSNDPSINPSLYTNDKLGSLISQYYIAPSNELQKDIDTIYERTAPFYWFGKTYGYISYKPDYSFDIPDKVYSYDLINKYVSSVALIHKPIPNSQSGNIKDFIAFVIEKAQGK